MIKIMKRVTASALWEIEGCQLTLPYKKEFPEEIMIKEIENYRKCLISKSYQMDNAPLRHAFRVFGGTSFAAVGMTG